MKKILALVLALAMALSLGSCALAEDVSLRVWVGDNQDIDWINKVIENFKAAHPENNYTIEVGVQTEGDCSKVVLTDPTAAADVFTFADDQFNSLMNGGALQPVVENAEEIIANNTPESVAAATGSDGMLYAYPATAITATSCSTTRNTSPRKTCRPWTPCWPRLPRPASTWASP